MTARPIALLAAVVAIAAIAVGCGGGDSSGSADSPAGDAEAGSSRETTGGKRQTGPSPFKRLR